MKKLLMLACILSLVLTLTGCTKTPNETNGGNEDFQSAEQLDDSGSETGEASGGMSLASFDYENEAARYQDGDANVNPNPFINTDPQPISDQIEAEERAKNKVTIEYNAISHYRDIEAGMWCIDFQTLDRTDDGIMMTSNTQRVYLDDNGITQLIVYEE